MPAERFYFKDPLAPQTVITAEGNEFHHLCNVMRVEKGESIELVNGLGVLAQGHVEHIEKRRALILVEAAAPPLPPPTPLVIIQAIPRGARLFDMIEKSTELGMTHLRLFPGDYSEKKELQPSALERIKSLAVSAMKQCGSLHLPTIEVCPPLNKWTEIKELAYFGDVDPAARPFKELWNTDNAKKRGAAFFIGPEKGFSRGEIDKLHSMGTVGVKLHQNILRTDTAPLAALSLMHHWLL